MIILFLYVLQLCCSVLATPYVGFPFDEQLPDIARLGEDYTFSMSSETFKSTTGSSLSYEVFNLPDWLSFDSSSLVLTGAPTTGNSDVGTVNFILQGTDAGGSLNQSCSIYLSDKTAPQLNNSNTVIDQLERIGSTNGYNGLILKPQTSFEIKFDKDTFEDTDSSVSLTYYGKSANRTSLPSWCFFDADSLTFSGTTPPVNSVNAASLEFDLTLIATDVAGYSAVYSNFNVVVGGHELFIDQNSYNGSIITNPGDSFSVDLPIDKIYLDDSTINSTEIYKIEIQDQPSWVNIENDSVLKGTVPDTQTSDVLLNITLYDIYGDSVFLNYDINILHEIFTIDTISNVTVDNGKWFQYSLSSSDFKNESATSLDINYSNNQNSWLNFYHSNNTFVGLVPQNFKELEIEINASMNNMKQSLDFFLIGKRVSSSSLYSSRYSSRTSSFQSSKTSLASSSSMITSTSTSSATTGASPSATAIPVSKAKNNSKALAIGLGVGIPVFLILLGCIILFCCCLGRRRKGGDDETDSEKGNDRAPYFTNDSNTTLTPPPEVALINENNLNKLEKDSSDNDNESYYSAAQSTLNNHNIEETAANSNIYQLANHHTSNDYLLTNPNSGSNKSSGIFNSWRRSSNANFKTRDSLNSLATVSTNDLLTVNMINSNKIRKSQLALSSYDGINSKTDSIPNLTTLREEEQSSAGTGDGISRGASLNSIATDAKLMGFENRQSICKSFKREEKSCHAEIYNLDEDFNDCHSEGHQSEAESSIYEDNFM